MNIINDSNREALWIEVDTSLPARRVIRVLEQLAAERRISTTIFCGDFCSPIPARKMGEFDGEVHCVFGNGDGDRCTIARFAQNEFPNLRLYGEYAELEIGVYVFRHFRCLIAISQYGAHTHLHIHSKPTRRWRNDERFDDFFLSLSAIIAVTAVVTNPSRHNISAC